MKSQPLVSVIIPNYNHARYLDQRIQSVLNQTYRNIEVIILDDCSTDNSLEVINKYKGDTRIKHIIVNEHNSGNTFLQWDKGLHLATGDLVWIAESDDYCELNLLEELIGAYQRNNSVLSYTTLSLVDDAGDITFRPKRQRTQFFSSKGYIRRYLSLANFIRNASCAVFSKQAALNVPKEYIDFIGAGDYLFWVGIASQGRIAIVNKGLSYFRRHSGVVTERRDADGSNFTAEHYILNRIKSIVHISFIRKKFICAYHCRRVRNTSYYSDDIRRKLFSLWRVDDNVGIISRMILKIADMSRNRFNYYL